jgi:hypothetical protein
MTATIQDKYAAIDKARQDLLDIYSQATDAFAEECRGIREEEMNTFRTAEINFPITVEDSAYVIYKENTTRRTGEAYQRMIAAKSAAQKVFDARILEIAE